MWKGYVEMGVVPWTKGLLADILDDEFVLGRSQVRTRRLFKSLVKVRDFEELGL